MDAWTRIAGRFIFAIPFLIFGLLHFIRPNAMTGMVPDFIPGGVFWVYLTGAAMLAASLSIMIQKVDKIASLLLGIMLLIFALTIHLPMAIDGDQSAMSGLLKDLALAGGAWIYSGYAAKS
ncbi:MAG: DoxX family protein [Bacteroidota bacterium]